MRRWFDTLFARVLLVQGVLALLVVVLFAIFAMRQQSQTLARAIAPVWAEALTPVIQNQTPVPHYAVAERCHRPSLLSTCQGLVERFG
jgi:hypothetical protein